MSHGNSSIGLTEVVGRALTDPTFRQGLAKDVDGTLASQGIRLSDGDVQTLKSIYPEVLEGASKRLAQGAGCIVWTTIAPCQQATP
jgi:hypothetical protein